MLKDDFCLWRLLLICYLMNFFLIMNSLGKSHSEKCFMLLWVKMGGWGETSKLFFIFAPILIFFKQNVHLYGLLKMAILFQKGV